VYRFFLNQWPSLCFLARDQDTDEAVGVVICKLEPHRNVRMRGYIGMLAVKEQYRGRGIAKQLVHRAIDRMIKQGAHEIMLETEVINAPAIGLYENMGFIRVKRLYRYYFNRHDAYRLILPVKPISTIRSGFLEPLTSSETHVNNHQAV
jgi:peptide alpha-N-acetyltransferase